MISVFTSMNIFKFYWW